MIPILYEASETTFSSNGLERLRDCTRCEIVEERNGIFECEFDYPVDGAHFDDIICGRIIAVKVDETGNVQPFDIYSYSKPINGIATFHACHISYRQSLMTVSGSAINDINDAFTLLGTASPSNPFTYWTDIESTNYMSGAEGVPKTVRQLLGGVEGSILDAYGGEYEWDKFTVKLWKSRGTARDYTIRYGVNLTDFEDDTDYSGSYNAVIPFWKGSNGNGVETVVKGNMVELGQESYTGRVGCIPLDLTQKFESIPTTAQLETAALSYMSTNQTALPSQNIKVDFIKDTGDFKSLQLCKLCDSVRVVFPRYGVNGWYKIVKTVFDSLLERYTEMELGTLSQTLSQALGLPDGSSTVQGAADVIIDEGTDGIWSYRKWSSGVSECWGTSATRTITSWSAWGGMYYGNPYNVYDTYPTGLFVSTPSCQAQIAQSTGDCFLVKGSGGSSTYTNAFYPARGSTSSAFTYTIAYYAVGRWK